MNKLLSYGLISLVICACSSGGYKKDIHVEESPIEENIYFEREKHASELSELPVDYEFDDQYLSENTLAAFEQRAIQKLKDFRDLLTILSDTTLDESFRKQAKNMIYDLFESPEIKMIHFPEPVNYQVSSSLTDFITSIEKESNPFNTLFENISISETLQPDEEELYRGILEFTVALNTDSIKAVHSKKLNMEIVARMTEKEFGNAKKTVWEVYLGNMF